MEKTELEKKQTTPWKEPSDAQKKEAAKKRMYDALHAVFPPDVKAAWPDPAARARWLPALVRRLVDDGSLDDAERWEEKVSFGSDSAAQRARSRLYVALAGRATDRRDALLRRAEELARGAVASATADPAPALELLEFLSQQGRADDLARDGATFAERFPDDGRVLAWWARGLVSSGDGDRAEAAFRRALAAPVKPPHGTGWELARLLLASSPPRKKEALEVLRSHGALADDRDALVTWKDLEIEFGHAEGPEEGRGEKTVDALIAALDRSRGYERLATARTLVIGDKAKGLSAATEAASLLPDLVDPWRLKGWYELRSKQPDLAAVSLGKAIEVSKEPVAERARARAYFRLFGFEEEHGRLLPTTAPQEPGR